MYTLRIIYKEDKFQKNINLGNSYSVLKKNTMLELYDKYRDANQKRNGLIDDNDDEYAFVVNCDSGECTPLYKNDFNIILNESGNVFDDLTN